MKRTNTVRLSESQKSKVARALDQHAKHKSCYFWTNNGNASSRAYKERINNWAVKFRNNGHTYEYRSEVRISRANYYYSGTFIVDGERKTVRAFKKLIGA